jgi:hypothetical protein
VRASGYPRALASSLAQHSRRKPSARRSLRKPPAFWPSSCPVSTCAQARRARAAELLSPRRLRRRFFPSSPARHVRHPQVSAPPPRARPRAPERASCVSRSRRSSHVPPARVSRDAFRGMGHGSALPKSARDRRHVSVYELGSGRVRAIVRTATTSRARAIVGSNADRSARRRLQRRAAAPSWAGSLRLRRAGVSRTRARQPDHRKTAMAFAPTDAPRTPTWLCERGRPGEAGVSLFGKDSPQEGRRGRLDAGGAR